MGKFIFIIGGARSGKSNYAQELAKKISRKVIFIATCAPGDSEMNKRVALHKKSRPHYWKTLEVPKNLNAAIKKIKNKTDVIIIDCLGLFISNLLGKSAKEARIKKEIKSINASLRKANFTSIIVSNEVGAGIVPLNPMARSFRDLLGLANQQMAEEADEVIMMQAGIPITIKRNITK